MVLLLPVTTASESSGVAQQDQHQRPRKPVSNRTVEMSNRRYIVFEDFHLASRLGVSRFPHGDDEILALHSLFPKAIGLAVYPWAVVFRFKQLPTSPWPISVAGLPLVLTIDQSEYGLEFGEPGGVLNVLREYDARKGISESMFRAVIHYFEDRHGIAISSLSNLGGPWFITVPDHAMPWRLPRYIARTACTYNFTSQKAQEQEGLEGNPRGCKSNDRSCQTCLDGRLGSYFCSERATKDSASFPELMSSCGIVVEDRQGSRYLTLANECFQNGEDVSCYSGLIGKIARRLPQSDIALLGPRKGQVPGKSAGSCCGNSSVEESPKQAECTNGFRDPFDLARFEAVYMQVMGENARAGIHVGMEMKRYQSSDEDAEGGWSSHQWSYFGKPQERSPVLAHGNGHRDDGFELGGSSGCAILDSDHNAVSFFQYASEEQTYFGVGTSTSALIKGAYRVSEDPFWPLPCSGRLRDGSLKPLDSIYDDWNREPKNWSLVQGALVDLFHKS
ncbi:MAG: hypothetical protein M1817_006631 [Caeruleum heppii]|nr:MAG: hypothetical protein M1817_006631 [Caeruleum heppii]